MSAILKGPGAGVIFICVLAAYTLQSELTSIVQRTYTKPYFLLYLTHCSYIILLPLHLLALRIAGVPIRPLLHSLRDALRAQLAAPAFSSANSPGSVFRGLPATVTFPAKGTNADDDEVEEEMEMGVPHATPLQAVRRRIGGRAFPWRRLIRLIVALTLMLAIPAGSWYIAVPLTTMANITALYNSNAFFAYIFSIFVGLEKWERRRGVAVVLAVVGVFVIAYGDREDSEEDKNGKGIGSRLLGNLLALFGAVTLAVYEIWYKKYASLPEPMDDDEGERPGMARRVSQATLMAGSRDPSRSRSMSRDSSRAGYQGVAADEDGEPQSPPPELPSSDLERPTATLFLLHADLLTTLIGFATVFILWIPIPILSFLGFETFELPPSEHIVRILGIMLGGVVFNGGFMILLGIWGAVTASVGNLCTLVLVVIADAYVSVDKTWPSGWGLAGIALITGAFAVLVSDMVTWRS